MQSLKRLLTAAAALLAIATAAPAAQAQTAPNLSGTWELDVTASSFGMMPAPQKATMIIEHAEPTLKVTSNAVTARGEQSRTSSYTTDGKESKNAGMGGAEAVSIVKWEGAVLTVNTKLSVQGNEVTVAEKWNVSADGKTLTIDGAINSPMGAMEQKRIYRKS